MRVFAISLGHCNPSVWERSATQFYATAGLEPVGGTTPRWLLNAGESVLDFEHLWVDHHYPLGDRRDAHDVCKRHGIRLLDPGRNLGLHGGFNLAMEHLGVRPGDLVLGYDPDSWPITPGWLKAMVEVAMSGGGRYAWVSLMNPVSRGEMQERGFRPIQVGQHVVWEALAPVVNSICLWSVDFLARAGGLKEPLEFYGYLECAMWPRLKEQDRKWVFIDGVWEGQELVGAGDPEYKQWKVAYAHQQTTKLHFADWLKAR